VHHHHGYGTIANAVSAMHQGPMITLPNRGPTELRLVVAGPWNTGV